MTLVGDVAQSTTPAGQERWQDVFAHLGPNGSSGTVADLTIGYRVPEPVLKVANRLLPLTGVNATESKSVRLVGDEPMWQHCASEQLAQRVATETMVLRKLHKVMGIVAPGRWHADIAEALAAAGFTCVGHVHELEPTEIPVFEAHAVKGLEFDGVLVVNPHEILAEGRSDVNDTPRGARLLYVAMTRAVQRLVLVTDGPAPAVIANQR